MTTLYWPGDRRFVERDDAGSTTIEVQSEGYYDVPDDLAEDFVDRDVGWRDADEVDVPPEETEIGDEVADATVGGDDDTGRGYVVERDEEGNVVADRDDAEADGGSDGGGDRSQGGRAQAQDQAEAETQTVGDAETEAETERDGEPTRSEEDADEVLDQTIGEFETEIGTGRYDDSLDVLEERERANRDRKGIKSAIDDRREEIGADEGEADSDAEGE